MSRTGGYVLGVALLVVGLLVTLAGPESDTASLLASSYVAAACLLLGTALLAAAVIIGMVRREEPAPATSSDWYG